MSRWAGGEGKQGDDVMVLMAEKLSSGAKWMIYHIEYLPKLNSLFFVSEHTRSSAANHIFDWI